MTFQWASHHATWHRREAVKLGLDGATLWFMGLDTTLSTLWRETSSHFLMVFVFGDHTAGSSFFYFSSRQRQGHGMGRDGTEDQNLHWKNGVRLTAGLG